MLKTHGIIGLKNQSGEQGMQVVFFVQKGIVVHDNKDFLPRFGYPTDSTIDAQGIGNIVKLDQVTP